LDNVVVVAPTQTPLGKLAGVVVDPINRQLRYYVIRVRRWLSTRHYLMPLRAARLTADAPAMQVDFDAEELKTFGKNATDALCSSSPRNDDLTIAETQWRPSRRRRLARDFDGDQ
jgi:hypothetical protein